jgi:hypothetical protein
VSMLKNLLRPFARANDFLFVVEVCVFAIVLSGVLLLLLIGILRPVSVLWKAKRAGDEKESYASSAQWAMKLFAKTTAIQLLWSIGVYIAFCLLDLSRDRSRLFILYANVICSIGVFVEGIRRLLRGRKRPEQ